MKKTVWLLVFFALCISLVGNVPSARALQAGSYKRIPINAEVRSAASYAVREIGRKMGKRASLVSITAAERQTVSGANYKVCVKVKVDGETKNAWALIYQNSRQQYSLQSWGWGRCNI